MNSKMTTNLQLSTTEPKKQKEKETKQTTRTVTESQKWRPHRGVSARRDDADPGRQDPVLWQQ